MRWFGVLCTLVLAMGREVRAEEPARARVGGTIETDVGHAEILAERIPVGRRIDLPEGWYRVEGEATDDGAVGSFSVVRNDRREPNREAPPPSEAKRADEPRLASAAPEPAAAPPPPCRAQRSAFFRELWKQSGVEVDDPDALLEGLDSGAGAATGYHWFALQVDPVRSMSWSPELRARAKALERCVNEARAASR